MSTRASHFLMLWTNPHCLTALLDVCLQELDEEKGKLPAESEALLGQVLEASSADLLQIMPSEASQGGAAGMAPVTGQAANGFEVITLPNGQRVVVMIKLLDQQQADLHTRTIDSTGSQRI